MFARPPITLNLLQSATPGDAQQLVLVLHHALYDGLSIAELFRAAEQLYRGSELPKSVQYHRLLPRIVWQEQNGTSFWVDRLRDLRHAPLPRKDSGPEGIPAVHQASLLIQVSGEEIRQVCSYAEVTPQCIGQAAFAKLLSTMTQCRDVVFGRVVSGRDIPGAEEVIGPMLVSHGPLIISDVSLSVA